MINLCIEEKTIACYNHLIGSLALRRRKKDQKMSQDRETILGSAPVGRLMIRFALPSITAQVVNILYSIVDRIYIGHLPDGAALALTGIGLCYPIITIISAFSLFAGSGGAPLAAIQLGKAERDADAKKEAEAILGNSCILLAGFSVILTALFLIFRRPVLFAFGASLETIGYAEEYLSVYLIGTIFVQISVGLNPFINSQGRVRTAMLSTIIGAATNIILDPIFIFVFGLGVKGAAIATVISQTASATWILLFLCSKRSAIRIRPQSLRFKAAIVRKISALGVSPFIMAATESAVFVVFNSGLQRHGGDAYVGAMTILQSLMQMCYVPIQGFTDGVQPLLSYNYGAEKYARLRLIIRRMVVVSLAVSICAFLILNVRPALFVSVFTSDEHLAELASRLLRIYCGAVWIFGIQMSAQRTFVALGKAGTSIIVALLRKVILLIPLALILPNFIGVEGIFLAEPLASTVSAATAGILLVRCYKKLPA